MSIKYDGAVIFDCSSVSNSDRYRAEIMRPLAPFALHNSLSDIGLPATVINYTEFWDSEELFKSLSTWFINNNIKSPLLLVSTLFSYGVFEPDNVITVSIGKLKQAFDCTILLGGPINVLDYNIQNLKPDAVFQGRSLHLFERWVVGDYSDLPISVVKGIEVFHDQSSEVIEDPVVPVLYADYCLNHNDIIHFETRLGCKFNRTFCAYEFRNAKKVSDATEDRLYKFFKQAHDLYGITRFSCVDDTFNEDQSKIDTLRSAVMRLDYKPTIVGYNRFDLLMAKPEQLKQLDDCGFHGHYFGIETLHRDASKLIRKGIRKEQALDFLRKIRDEYPHWWVCSGYIVGLPLEPVEHITQVMAEIRSEKLLS